jgi:hypothetical protein
MNYPTDIAMWRGGRYDAWCTARDPGYGMAHVTREDLPFYYALADAFTLGDQYFQSTFTQVRQGGGCRGAGVVGARWRVWGGARRRTPTASTCSAAPTG